jgi:hypothetical protein
MTDCARSARLSPDERLGEIAAILAAGLLRLDQRAALPAEESPENPPKTLPEGLELSRQTRLSVHCG